MIRRPGVAVAAVVLALSAAPALAGDPAPSARNLELARQLFEAMHMERTMAGVTAAMAPTMRRQLEAAAPQMTSQQQAAIAQVTNELMQEMTRRLTAEMTPVYASTFTEKELTEVLAFYRSPTGQSMLEKTPLVMAKLQPTMTAIMPEMMSRMRQKLCAELGCPAQ